MEKEHTPAETRPNRTVYRLTKSETIRAMEEWLTRQGHTVPAGERFIWHPSGRRFYPETWALTLGVDHHDPPPTRKDVNDE